MLLDSFLQPLPGDNLLHRFQKNRPVGLLLFMIVFGAEKADLIHEVPAKLLSESYIFANMEVFFRCSLTISKDSPKRTSIEDFVGT